MFLRSDHDLELAGAGASRVVARAAVTRPAPSRPERWRAHLAAIDWVPDLGAQIGGRDWWRGLVTLVALVAAAWTLSPGRAPLIGAVPAPLAPREWEEARAQAIAPLAWGADTGRRMAANDLVVPLAEAPERPSMELSATIGEGDDLTHALQRAGVGRADTAAATALVGGAVTLGDIPSGTRVDLTLGRRPSKLVARPLERLRLRARFDLALTLARAGDRLTLTRQPIAIDTTPLRLQGLVGSSLYRSARAAGAPARAVEEYIKALASRLSIGRDIAAADGFDLILERQRAATGEVRLGELLFAGIDQGAGKLRLVRADGDGDGGSWFDADGRQERHGFMGMPVAGHITSGFGLRFHPLLGFTRMHKGIDIGAPWGTPVYAVLDGTVALAGRNAGYGNFIKLLHGGGLGTGYGHLSRIAVAAGQHVGRGQVIGYVGSTGLSTGPHLHWEVWRNGEAVNPMGMSFSNVVALTGEKLRAFKARVAGLLAVKVGA